MLREQPAKHVRDDRPRRWFADDDHDFIVWLDADSTIYGFQFCYDRNHDERALTWTREHGFSHRRVDPGDALPTKNRTPILVGDGTPSFGRITAIFEGCSGQIDPAVRAFVLTRLRGPDAP